MDILNHVPELLIQFVIVLLFSLLIGLEQRRLQNEKKNVTIPFGTDRTFAFIGVLGFIMYVLEPEGLALYITGACLLGVIFSIYYFKKIHEYKAFGITKILVGIITYTLAPVVITQPKWVSALIVVSVLLLVESKDYFIRFSGRFSDDEFITLAKFLIIAGVILPIVPDTPISDLFTISPYQIWLSLVVVSGISYFSYLLQKFVFKESGILITGILGGIYSSTATTIILSKKSREQKSEDRSFGAGILIAISLMYIRVFALMVIFNRELAAYLFVYILILFIVSAGLGIFTYLSDQKKRGTAEQRLNEKNPLELKLALVFSVLFLLFSFLTTYTLENFGTTGLNILSYVIGFTDIDPFLLNLFQGKYAIELSFIARLSLQAIVANNILKMITSVVLGGQVTKKIVVAGMGIITLVNIILIFFI